MPTWSSFLWRTRCPASYPLNSMDFFFSSSRDRLSIRSLLILSKCCFIWAWEDSPVLLKVFISCLNSSLAPLMSSSASDLFSSSKARLSASSFFMACLSFSLAARYLSLICCASSLSCVVCCLRRLSLSISWFRRTSSRSKYPLACSRTFGLSPAPWAISKA